jgi:hypothetical protein
VVNAFQTHYHEGHEGIKMLAARNSASDKKDEIQSRPNN